MRYRLDIKSFVRVVFTQLLDEGLKENISYWVEMHRNKRNILSQFNLLSDKTEVSGVAYTFLLELLNSKNEKFFQYNRKNLFPEEAMKFVFHQLSEMVCVSLWVYSADTHMTYSPKKKSFRDIPVLISQLPDGTCCSRVPNLETYAQCKQKTSSNQIPKPSTSQDKVDWAKLIAKEMREPQNEPNSGVNAESEGSDFESDSSEEMVAEAPDIAGEIFPGVPAPDITVSNAVVDLEHNLESDVLSFKEKYEMGKQILECELLHLQKLSEHVHSKTVHCEVLCSHCCLL